MSERQEDYELRLCKGVHTHFYSQQPHYVETEKKRNWLEDICDRCSTERIDEECLQKTLNNLSSYFRGKGQF